MSDDKKKTEKKNGPAEKIAKSGKEIADQSAEIYRKASYAGLSLTSELRGKGDGLFDSIIDVVEKVQVSTLEMIDNNSDGVSKGIEKIAKAIDEGLDAVEGEISGNVKEAGAPSLGKPLTESANMAASVVENVQKSITGVVKPLLDDEDEESKEWDDDLADW